MQWIKKGLLFCPDGKSTWNQKGYAHVVCADTSYEDKLRLYYSARDKQGRCQASFIDLDSTNLSNILYVHPDPILDLGEPGTFDDCGIMPTWFMQNGAEKWLYYIGWTVRNTIPYHNALGLASSRDGIHFTKKFTGPIISTTATEPFFNGSACFLFDEGKYKVWYLNCTHWIEDAEVMEPCYHIKYAESTDGINWNRLDEQVGIDVSENPVDWDYSMIEYPLVINHKGEKIMFYNGNHFGQTGVGYAVME
jgi:hypothetical protein